MLPNILTTRKRSYTYSLEKHTYISTRLLALTTPTTDTNTHNTKRYKKMYESKSNYIIVIDTETTGLFARNSNPENYELFNNARMVEIAWEIYTSDGVLVNSESYIIKPYDFVIPESAIAIHGITNEEAQSTGIQITNVFDRLLVVLKDVNIIVAHNFPYDNAIILAELYRHNFVSDGLNKYTNLIDIWMSKTHKCTMAMGESNTKLNTRVKKWHKLVDLYRLCFNKEPECVLHRAAADVSICAKIYFYLV